MSEDRIEQCRQLDLKSVIQEFGGEFSKGGMFSIPSLYGREETASGKIYTKNGRQLWYHHKSSNGGDAIQFVKLTMGVDTSKAINMLLGEEKGHAKREISPIVTFCPGLVFAAFLLIHVRPVRLYL